jgi:hypothetical protein
MTFGFLQGRSDYEPDPEARLTTWGTVSSGFREIGIGWDLWGFLPHSLPQECHESGAMSTAGNDSMRSLKTETEPAMLDQFSHPDRPACAGAPRREDQDNPALCRPRSIAGARVRAKVAVRWLLSR